jgi:hypothetical protein
MAEHGDWNADSLACLWTREKTARLVRGGLLASCGTDHYGRQLYRHQDVWRYYAFRTVPAGAAGLHAQKAFGPGGAEYPAEYEPDIAEGEYPE